MASVILAQETTPAIGAAAAGLTLLAAGLHITCTHITCTRTTHCPLRRLLDRQHVGATAT